MAALLWLCCGSADSGGRTGNRDRPIEPRSVVTAPKKNYQTASFAVLHGNNDTRNFSAFFAVNGHVCRLPSLQNFNRHLTQLKRYIIILLVRHLTQLN